MTNLFGAAFRGAAFAAAVSMSAAPAFAAEPAGARVDDGDRSEAQGVRLVGTYEIVAAEKDGVPVPKERLNNTVAITADVIAVVDRDKKELYSAAYKLGKTAALAAETREQDRTDGPGTAAEQKGAWTIDLVSKVPKAGEKAAGLVKQDGNQLWLVYDLTGQRPQGFEKTTRGQHLFKMRKATDEPGLQEPAGGTAPGGK